MHAMIVRASRGQTLIETALFMPLVLLLLFGVIYFSNLGVVFQRTQIAARYGATVGFGGGTSGPYSAAAIYSAQVLPGGTCATPPPGIFSNSSPFPGPTSAPYWHPDWTKTSSTCTPKTLDLVGAQFLASRYLMYGSVSVTAQSVMPAPLPNFLTGGLVPGVASEQMNWVHPAWPASILACTNKTAAAVQEALTAIGTSPATSILPAGWPPTCTNS